MSISSSGTRKSGPYSGNGGTTAFPFTFKVFQASDLRVVQTDTTPTDYTLVLNTDYTVALNANQDANPGGTVNMVVAPPAGYLLTIGSNVPELQSVTLTNNGGFYPTVINSALDYVTILVQQLSEKIGRALTLPFSTSGTVSAQLPPVAPGQLLGWKADGSGIANVGAAGVGAGGIVAANMAAGATGSALSADTQAAAAKAAPADADKLALFDSANFWYLKGLTWANLKAALAAFIGSLLNMTGAINYARTTVASAAAPDIWTGTGNNINYTGNTTATGFAPAPQAGASRILDCAAACSFTAGANMLIDGVAAGQNLTVLPGDRVSVMARTTTQFVLTLMPAGGAAALSSSVKGAFKNYAASAIGLNNYNATVTADEVVLENSANQYHTARAVNLTINANGVVGAPLSVASARAANTWYYIWLWYNATAGLTATLDTSSAAPTAPTGYASTDYNARLPGAMRTDGSANTYLLQIAAKGRRWQYVVLSGSNVPNLPLMASGVSGSVTTPTWTAVATGAYVPPMTASIKLALNATQTANIICMAAPSNEYGAGASSTNPPPLMVDSGTSGTGANNMLGEFMLESSNIYYAANGTACSLTCVGGEDNV